MKAAEEQTKANAAIEKAADIGHKAQLSRDKNSADQRLGIQKSENDLDIEGLKAEVDATVERFKACSGTMAEALTALSRDDVMIKVAQAASVNAMIGGNSITEVLQKIFAGTPIGEMDIAKWIGAHAATLPEGFKAGVAD